MCVFATVNTYGTVGMHLYEAYAKGKSPRDAATIGAEHNDKSQITAGASEGKNIYDLFITANTTLSGSYNDLSDEGKLLLDAALTDIWTNKDGKGEIWQEFLETCFDIAKIDSTDKAVTWINTVAKEVRGYSEYAKTKTKITTSEDAYGKTDKRAWRLCGQDPARIQPLVDHFIALGKGLGSNVKGTEVTKFAKRLKTNKVDLTKVEYNGKKLFASTAEGNEEFDYTVVNDINNGDKDTVTNRWAAMFLWFASNKLTDGHFEDGQQLYYYTRFGQCAGQGGAGASQRSVKTKEEIRKDKQIEAMVRWAEEQGWYYDEIDEEMAQLNW